MIRCIAEIGERVVYLVVGPYTKCKHAYIHTPPFLSRGVNRPTSNIHLGPPLRVCHKSPHLQNVSLHTHTIRNIANIRSPSPGDVFFRLWTFASVDG